MVQKTLKRVLVAATAGAALAAFSVTRIRTSVTGNAWAGLPQEDVLTADVIYAGGTIITMNDTQPGAEAVALRDGRILAVGLARDVFRHREVGTQVVDLKGRTLLPAFLDPHSHITTYVGIWGWPDLTAAPAGDVGDIDRLIEKLRTFIAERSVPGGQLVAGFNYDSTALQEKRSPTASELDRVSIAHPVVVFHAGGRAAAGNHMAMARAGLIGARDLERHEGEHEEPVTAAQRTVRRYLALLPERSPSEQLAALDEVQKYYARHGIATVQDGFTTRRGLALLRSAAENGRLILDVVAYPSGPDYASAVEGHMDDLMPGVTASAALHQLSPTPDARLRGVDPAVLLGAGRAQLWGDERSYQAGHYSNRLKIGGISIQGDAVELGEEGSRSGPTYFAQSELDRWFEAAFDRGVQVFMHCSGDACFDQMLRAVRTARARYGHQDRRPVAVHTRLLRNDQLDSMAILGVVPSFSTARAPTGATLPPVPLAPALKRRLRATNHTDAPGLPPDPIRLIHAAVNASGTTALDALRASTLNSAYQHFEENEKGSIQPGKRADLVVLSDNPLTVPAGRIREIRVLRTIKDGVVIFDELERDALIAAGWVADK